MPHQEVHFLVAHHTVPMGSKSCRPYTRALLEQQKLCLLVTLETTPSVKKGLLVAMLPAGRPYDTWSLVDMALGPCMVVPGTRIVVKLFCCTKSIHQPVVCIDHTSNMEDVDNQTTDKNNKEEENCNKDGKEEEESNLVTPTPTPTHHPPINIVTQ